MPPSDELHMKLTAFAFGVAVGATVGGGLIWLLT